MPQVTLSRTECERDLLPAVCVVCGESADVRKSRKFAWHTPLAYLGLLAGLLPFVIIALVLTKRMTVKVPLCQAHKNHWTWRSLVVLGSLLAIGALGIGVLVMQANQQPGNDSTWMCLGGVLLLLVWLIAAAIIQSTAVRPTEITDRSIRLTKIHPAFIDALERDRDEDRAERRTRRKQYNDERDDYDDDFEGRPRRRPARDDRDGFDEDDDRPRRRSPRE
jgi:hypothetical protein